MKTTKELNTLKEEICAMKEKLSGLTEEELQQLFGGDDSDINRRRGPSCPFCGDELSLAMVISKRHIEYYVCPVDGQLTYFYVEDRWERGWN